MLTVLTLLLTLPNAHAAEVIIDGHTIYVPDSIDAATYPTALSALTEMGRRAAQAAMEGRMEVMEQWLYEADLLGKRVTEMTNRLLNQTLFGIFVLPPNVLDDGSGPVGGTDVWDSDWSIFDLMGGCEVPGCTGSGDDEHTEPPDAPSGDTGMIGGTDTAGPMSCVPDWIPYFVPDGYTALMVGRQGDTSWVTVARYRRVQGQVGAGLSWWRTFGQAPYSCEGLWVEVPPR